MIQIVHRTPARSIDGQGRPTAGRPVFDDAGAWIGTVSSGGAVLDADGVQMGVEWPNGEIVDFRGVRIGRLWRLVHEGA